jgi:pyruvate dehydrogenase E2 component (dihydrolipoamide acetyltransferase)
VGLDLIPWPKVDFAKFGPIERKELSRIKKISGANLLRNWVMIPACHQPRRRRHHRSGSLPRLHQQGERKERRQGHHAGLPHQGLRGRAQEIPRVQQQPGWRQLVYKQYFHIGFAADTPNGLVVPVIKDADKKGIFQISQEMGELAKKARDGKLSPADMSGACFTISSWAALAARYFTPIINAPEVAILGVCRSTMNRCGTASAFQPRLMLPLSLTWDHRVIDGAAAARFNAYLGQILGDFRRVLL